MNEYQFTLFRTEDRTVRFSFTNPSGEPVDLSGYEFEFTLFPERNGKVYVPQKYIVLDGSNTISVRFHHDMVLERDSYSFELFAIKTISLSDMVRTRLARGRIAVRGRRYEG